jgi:hypothetical protein
MTYVYIEDRQYQVMPCLIEAGFLRGFPDAILSPQAEEFFLFFNAGYKLTELPANCCFHHYFVFAMMHGLQSLIGDISKYWLAVDTCALCLDDTANQRRVATKHTMYIQYRALVMPVILPLMIGRPLPPGPPSYDVMTYHRDGQIVMIPNVMHTAILKVLASKIAILNFT